jgi:hypothetical protein
VVADGHLHPGKPFAALAHPHDDARIGVEGLRRGDADEAEGRGVGRGDGGRRLQAGSRSRSDDVSFVGVILASHGDGGRRRGRGVQRTRLDASQVEGGDLRPDRFGGPGQAAGDG